jgi:hypothetical protein
MDWLANNETYDPVTDNYFTVSVHYLYQHPLEQLVFHVGLG